MGSWKQCDAVCKILQGKLCAINVVAPFKCTTYLSISAQQPFMKKISFDGCTLIYQHNAATKEKLRKGLRSITMGLDVDLTSKPTRA